MQAGGGSLAPTQSETCLKVIRDALVKDEGQGRLLEWMRARPGSSIRRLTL